MVFKQNKVKKIEMGMSQKCVMKIFDYSFLYLHVFDLLFMSVHLM